MRALLEEELEEGDLEEAVLPEALGGAVEVAERGLVGGGELVGDGATAVEAEEEAVERFGREGGGEEAVESVVLVGGGFDVGHRASDGIMDARFRAGGGEADADRWLGFGGLGVGEAGRW